MRVLPAFAVLLLIGAFMVPGASAQEAPETTWYLNSFTEPSGAGAFLSIDGPGGNDMTSTSLGIDPVELTFAEKDAGFAAGYLGAAGEGKAFAYVKSWNSLPAPQTKVEFTIKAGDEVIGTASETHDVLNGAIVEYAVTFPYEAGDLPAGTLISMSVRITSLGGDGSPAFYPRGDGTNHWRVVLPVTGIVPVDAPAVTFEPLNGTTLEHVFENATSGTFVHNFTTNLTLAVGTFAVNGTGLVNATLTQGNATMFYNGTVHDGNLTNFTLEVFDMLNVTADELQLVLHFTDFNGTFHFDVAAPVIDIVEPEGNATGNETIEPVAEGEKAPGVALPLLALGVIAVAFVARRRQ